MEACTHSASAWWHEFPDSAYSLVSSKLDYYNSLYSGISQANLNKYTAHTKDSGSYVSLRRYKYIKIWIHHFNTHKITLDRIR